MIKANKFDLVLKMYLSNDTLRPAMCKVNNNNGRLEVTNASVLILMPEKYVGLKYDTVEKYPNVDAVIPTELKGDSVTVTTDALAMLLASSEASFKKETAQCEKCKGEGVVECHCCGNDADCEKCDGGGKTESQHPFAKMNWKGKDVMVENRCYAFDSLYTIWMTALILEAKELVFKHRDNESLVSGTIIEIDDVTILVIPRMKSENF